jgi:hypothetical protein
MIRKLRRKKMTEYIEREKLENAVKGYFKNAIDNSNLTLDTVDCCADLMQIIEDIPKSNRNVDIVNEGSLTINF